jgi:hypothetical protein
VASSIEVIASTTAASLGLERALACAPPSTLLQGEAAAAVRGRSHEVGVEEERERWRRREEGNLGVDGPRPSDMDRVRDFFFLSRPFFSHPTRFLFLAHPTLTRGSPTTSRYARLACPPVRYRGTLSDRASTHALAYSQLWHLTIHRRTFTGRSYHKWTSLCHTERIWCLAQLARRPTTQIHQRIQRNL